MRRPTEEQALAKIMMEKYLTRLTPVQRHAVILHASGFTFREIGEIKGTNLQAQNQAWRLGLERLRG